LDIHRSTRAGRIELGLVIEGLQVEADDGNGTSQQSEEGRAGNVAIVKAGEVARKEVRMPAHCGLDGAHVSRFLSAMVSGVTFSAEGAVGSGSGAALGADSVSDG